MSKIIKARPVHLGSGKLHLVEVTDAFAQALATTASALAYVKANAVDSNILGYISGGASLSYAMTTNTVEDDLGLVSKTVITTENVDFTSGLMTWNGITLEKLCETCRISDDPISGHRMIKIGGIDNANGKRYVVIFVHEDKADGNMYVILTGKNTSGFKLDFKKDAASVVDATFTAEAMDSEGTKVVIIEEISQDGIIEVTATEGTEEGTTKLSVTNTLNDGESYSYLLSNAIPAYLSKPTGDTAWAPGDAITADTGASILLLVKNADGEVVKAGICKAVSKAEATE